MTTIDKIKAEYPLHWSVWIDDHNNLQELLKTGQVSQNGVACICFASQMVDGSDICLSNEMHRIGRQNAQNC